MRLKESRFALSFFIILLLGNNAYAQRDRVENLPKYNHESLHFGFTIGLNYTDFVIHPVRDFHLQDSLKTVQSLRQPGFNLGIVSEVKLHEYLAVRFVPALSFGGRTLQYFFETPTDTFVAERVVESTFLDFPVNLKLRSARVNNFGAYLVGGAKYTYDLASQRNVRTSTNFTEQIVKLDRHDFGYEGGVGVDFFLQYFKLAIEAKMSLGTRNVLIKDNTIFSNSIDKLNSKVFLISITFEG